jgi:RNA polymerase sigma-70 factor (ECF subfamily)
MNKRFNILSDRTDEELWIRLQQDDEDAFTTIYGRYHKALYTIAYRYLKDRERARDAVQQLFLKLWECRSLRCIRISLKSYLFTMLKNYVLNEIRNHLTAMEKNYEISQLSERAVYEFMTEIEEEDLIQQLYTAIEILPKQKKAICLYKLKDHLSNQAIADRMHISIPTVKTHYSQAIRFLKDYFHKTMLMLLLFSVYSSHLNSYGERPDVSSLKIYAVKNENTG